VGRCSLVDRRLKDCAVIRDAVGMNREVILGQIDRFGIFKPDWIIGSSPGGKRAAEQNGSEHADCSSDVSNPMFPGAPIDTAR